MVLSCPLICSLSSLTANQRAAQNNYRALGCQDLYFLNFVICKKHNNNRYSKFDTIFVIWHPVKGHDPDIKVELICVYSVSNCFFFVLTFDSSFLDRNECHFIVMSIVWTNTSIGNFCCNIIFSYVTCIDFTTKMCYYMPLLWLTGFTVLGPSRQSSGSRQAVVS